MVSLSSRMHFVRFACIVVIPFISLNDTLGGARNPIQHFERCNYWQAKVDPSVEVKQDIAGLSEEDDARVLRAIECLLKLKGKTSPSTFSSATVGYDLSQRFPPPTVEVAALYYASYLYCQKWQHGHAMILLDKKGRKNTKESKEVAYRAYQSWLERIKGVGLHKAREDKLDPLAGTAVRWY